jgi:hypothetical protein
VVAGTQAPERPAKRLFRALQEAASFGVVLLLARKHLIVELARLAQARIEALALVSVGIQTKLVCSHIRSIHDWGLDGNRMFVCAPPRMDVRCLLAAHAPFICRLKSAVLWRFFDREE